MNSPPDLRRRWPVIPAVILSAFSLFFLFELAEILWLADWDDATLSLMREGRTLLTCLALVGATVAAAVRRRPSPFPSVEPPPDPRQEPSLLHLAGWFLWMRWLACSTAAVLVLVTVEIGHLLPETLLLPLLGCVTFLALANVLFTWLLVHHPEAVAFQVSVQVLTDLGTLTALLHFSGGLENPLSLLYLFHVIIAGILFSRGTCYQVALAAFAMFATLVGLEYLELIPHYTLEIFPHEDHGGGEGPLHAAHYGPYVLSRVLLQALILLITGYFITTIMERLRKREQDARDLAIRESEARGRLESVVDAAGAGLRLLDADLHPVWTNARFHQWAPAVEDALATAARTLADGLTRDTEHGIDGPDKRRRHYATTTAIMSHGVGQPRHVVQLVQDVTERKRAEAESLHAGKLAAVGELAGNLAHEINNPLGILSARLHLLLKDTDLPREKTVDALSKMGCLVDRISGITRSLLGHVRPTTGDRKPIQLEQLFDRAAALMENWARRKDIHLRFDLAPGTPAVLGVAGELEQVLTNLLLNAVDASPRGGSVLVEGAGATLAFGRQVLRVTVEDAGLGVPESLRTRIFEAFFSTKKAGEGTGLGLSISKRIVDNHNGTIRVEQGDQGARFVVDIPALPDAGS